MSLGDKLGWKPIDRKALIEKKSTNLTVTQLKHRMAKRMKSEEPYLASKQQGSVNRGINHFK